MRRFGLQLLFLLFVTVCRKVQDENILIREGNRIQPADAALQPLVCTTAQVPVNVPVPDGNGQLHPQPALQHAGLGAVPQLPAGWVFSKNFILQQMTVGNVQALQLCYGHAMGINPGDPLATRRNKVGLFLFGMNMGV